MTQRTKQKRQLRRTQTSTAERARGRKYNLMFVALALFAAAYVGYHLLRQSDASTIALNSGQTNAIPANGSAVTSSSASDTDVAGLRAAESGQLAEPALVWFHADW